MSLRHWKAIASQHCSTCPGEVCRTPPSAYSGPCKAPLRGSPGRHDSLPPALSVHSCMATVIQKASPQDTPYLGQLKTLPSTLVFIMGCHRSGTSMLHHLLAYTGELNYLTAYDVVHYDSIIFNRVNGCEAEVKSALQQRLAAEKDRGLD